MWGPTSNVKAEGFHHFITRILKSALQALPTIARSAVSIFSIYQLLPQAASFIPSAEMDGFMEVFALFGAPARIFGRIPLIMRYACTGLSDPWIDHQYARERYGPSYRIRPWLLFDIGELRMIEQLINKASDKTVSDFRKNQLEQLHMVSVVVRSLIPNLSASSVPSSC